MDSKALAHSPGAGHVVRPCRQTVRLIIEVPGRTLPDQRGEGPYVSSNGRDQEQPTPAVYTGIKRLLAITIGILLVGVGIVGIFIPGLPATVWFLMASYLFARSSERLHAKLRSSKVAGRLVRDWEDHRAIQRQAKVRAIALVVVFASLSIAFAPIPTASRIGIAVLGAIGITVIGRLAVVPAEYN